MINPIFPTQGLPAAATSAEMRAGTETELRLMSPATVKESVIAGSLATGLVAFWKLEDLTDASGNGNALTNNNSVTFGSGKIGDAAETDGTNYLEASAVEMPLSGDFTVSAWINADALQPDSFSTPLHTENNACSIIVTATSVDFYFGAAAATYPFSILGEGWKFIVFGVTGTDAFVQVDAGTTYLASYTAPVSEPFRIGSNIAGGGNNEFSGKIDCVGVWQRSLSALEKTFLYAGGAGLEPF